MHFVVFYLACISQFVHEKVWKDFVKGLAEFQLHYIHCMPFSTHFPSHVVTLLNNFKFVWHPLFLVNAFCLLVISLSSSKCLQTDFLIIWSSNFLGIDVTLTIL